MGKLLQMKLNWNTANDQINRGFIFLKKELLPQGFFCPCPEAVYMCMIIIFKLLFSKPLGQSRPNFIWSPLGKRECKFCENGLTHMTKMAAMPIHGEIFSRIQSLMFLKHGIPHKRHKLYKV